MHQHHRDNEAACRRHGAYPGAAVSLDQSMRNSLVARNGSARFWMALLIIAALAGGSFARNSVYRDEGSLWSDVTAKSPLRQRAWFNYGSALARAGSHEEAVRAYGAALSLPTDGRTRMESIYLHLGLSHFSLGRIDEALATWKSWAPYATSRKPDFLNNIAVALHQSGDYDEALRYAEAAQALQPDMSAAYNTLGRIYLSRRRFAEASAYFDAAIRLSPDVSLYYWNAALVAENKGDDGKALEFVGQYLKLTKDAEERREALRMIERLNTGVPGRENKR